MVHLIDNVRKDRKEADQAIRATHKQVTRIKFDCLT